MRYRVDPRKVKSVQMRDGTTYEVSRNGYVSIDRNDHLDQLRRRGTDALNAEQVLESPTLMVHLPDGNVCPGCGFSAWPWQRSCPRCGGRL